MKLKIYFFTIIMIFFKTNSTANYEKLFYDFTIKILLEMKYF